jgi:O-antigen ligase
MLWSTSKKKGQHVAALNTHNAYTQVSSEQGIPALVFYVTAIVIGLRISWRVYKKTRGNVGWADLNMLALSHFAALLFFAVNAFFHHSGGSMFLPCAVGLAIAIDYISQGLLTKDYQAALKAH